MYTYLTGSASWFLLTMLTEVYGVRGKLGDLVLEPKLNREQFGPDGMVSVFTCFANKKLKVSYINPELLPYGQYVIDKITANGNPILEKGMESYALLSAEQITAFPDQIDLEVYLGAK